MAKQEAFEEKIKLRNQFRSLDEDEVEFLDSVMESTRAQEAAVKKDTAEQLEVFRQHREEAEKALLEDAAADVAPVAEGEDWKIPSRKRRRDKNKDLLVPGKKRKSTSEHASENSPQSEQITNVDTRTGGNKETPSDSTAKTPTLSEDGSKSNNPKVAGKSSGDDTTLQQQTAQTTKPSMSLGLANYGSDSE